MQTYDEFKQFVLNTIQEIEQEYLICYRGYEPNEKEQKLIIFLNDIWGVRFFDVDKVDCLKNASVQLSFIDKENAFNYFDKNFRLSKLHPKNRKTMPLYFLISRLADMTDFNFYFCPNIYVRTKGHYQNWEQYVSASNCYFVDIDEVNTIEPVYNCTEQEILAYLYEKYEVLKKCPPSYIIMSGGGLHLYFSLQHTEYLFGNRYHNKERGTHRELTNCLIKALEADPACKNMNRLLRVPYSTNMKYNIKTRFFLYPKQSRAYTYEDFTDIMASVTESREASTSIVIKPKQTKEYKPKEHKAERNVSTTAEYRSHIAQQAKRTLFLTRKTDLEFWFNLHKADMKGRRHNFFLVYSVILKQLHFSRELILDRCLKMNNLLTEPIPDAEIFRIVEQEYLYQYQNQTYADLLNFTQTEIAMMSCHYGELAIAQHRYERSIINGEREKEKRHKKQQEKEEHIFHIIEQNMDLPLSKLAKLIGCHKSSAYRWKNKYIESR